MSQRLANMASNAEVHFTSGRKKVVGNNDLFMEWCFILASKSSLDTPSNTNTWIGDVLFRDIGAPC